MSNMTQHLTEKILDDLLKDGAEQDLILDTYPGKLDGFLKDIREVIRQKDFLLQSCREVIQP